MKKEIYESIIRNSKIAYLKINCKKDNHNKYIGIEVLEQNKEFEKIFSLITEENVFSKESTESIINNCINNKLKSDEFDEIINYVIKNGHKKLECRNYLDKKIIIDIYYLGDYFILIYSIDYDMSFDTENLKKSLDQDEENFKDITQHCGSVFIIRDKERAIYVSPAFKNVFETDASNLYERFDNLETYFKGTQCDDCNTTYEFNFEKCNEGIRKVKLENGKEKWIWYKFLPIIDSKGNVSKRVGILTDITEKRRAEEEENQLKLDFFANLSHELRIPINLISSTIQLIKLNLVKLPPKEADKFYKYMDIMETNNLRLVRLINNLLDSSRIDAGFVNFNPINADIVGFIENICDSIVEFTEFNHMNLIFDTDKEEEIVLFDPDIIERTILNLLSNAVKFNKENGNIYVNVYTNEENITISIKDEGIGIPKEKISCIFERFQQVHSKNRIEKQGSGIGLYLVKSLVTLHGGTIKLKSEINKGSEFIVTIPRKVLNKDGQTILRNEEDMYKRANIEFSDV